MSLPECVLRWPAQVSGQVMRALFAPALDLHPAQAQALVPPALQHLPPARLSLALEPALDGWPAQLDGRRLEHRLALLPRSVIEAVAWNLGLLASAASLRRRVLRSELQELAGHGLQEPDWALALAAPRQASAVGDSLADWPLAQWPARMRERGEQALAALAASLEPVLGARLRGKLAPAQATALPGLAALLPLAYSGPVRQWSAQWDGCLAELRPAN